MWIAVRLCGGSHFLFYGNHRWGWGIVTNIERMILCAGPAESVEDAVISVEEISRTIREAIGGAEKRTAAVEMLMKRFRPRLMPKMVFRFFAGYVVDRVVAELNAELGHDWGIYGVDRA